MHRKRIVIATVKKWNIENAFKLKNMLSGDCEIYIFKSKEELEFKNLHSIKPTYIFFPHWSWQIPESIFAKYKCVGFHITDLPFGRGGSPLQNLIERKIYKTKITAFRIGKEIDAGDIYLKRDLFIGLGSAEEIYMFVSEIIFFDMIPYIIRNNPNPQKQKGEVIYFKRRSPLQSDLLKSGISNLQEAYDFIRMLDADGYPKAFIKLGKLKIEFSEVHKKYDRVVGRFEIIEEDEN